MAHRLEAHAEALRQQVDVVQHLFGGAEEAAVRQDQRAREIAGQADARQRARFRTREAARVRQLVDQRAGLEIGQLRRQLERALARLRGIPDVQDLVARVESAQRGAFGVRALLRQGARGDAVRAKQERLQPAGEVARVGGALAGVASRGSRRLARARGRPAEDFAQGLRPLVQRGDVVVPLVEEVAHLLVRLAGRGRQLARAVPEGGCQRRQTLLRVAAAPVHADDDLRQRGHLLRERAQLRPGDDRVARGLCHHGLQLCGQARLVVVREDLQVDPEGRLQAQQHRHAQGALVVLELVEIAGGQGQELRQRGLRQAPLFAERLELHAQESLAHGASS